MNKHLISKGADKLAPSSGSVFRHTEKNDSLNLLNFFKVSGRNQFILATFK